MPYPIVFDDPKIQALYEAGQALIDRMRAELVRDEHGCIALPFRCYGCDQSRFDLAMMTGDGLPLCCGCFNGGMDALRADLHRGMAE